jgi:hypothetical protein
MTYFNTAPDSKASGLPVEEYHLTTPLEQYDLVSLSISSLAHLPDQLQACFPVLPVVDAPSS